MTLAYLPPILPQPRRAAELALHTRPALTAGERRQFAAVPRYVQRGDPRWTPALPYARQRALRAEDAPWSAGESAGFLGIAQNLGLGDEAVGAIAVRAAHQGGLGEWGLFDAINLAELSERLLYEAETWLFEHTSGIARLRGPASFELLTPAGMLVDGFDVWPAALLPYNPPYYPELIEAEGYTAARHWTAWTLPCATRPAGPNRSAPLREYKQLATAYGAIAVERDAAPGLGRWLEHLAGSAAPFPAHPHWRWIAGQAFRKAVSVTATWPGGSGVCFGIPDFAPALRLTGSRLFPFGYALFAAALTRSRQLRVFPAHAPPGWAAEQLAALYAQLAQEASRQGYQRLIIAPFAEEDEKSAAALMSLGARIAQRFAIYEKAL